MNIVSGDPNFIEIKFVLHQFKKYDIRSIFTNLGWRILISRARRIKMGSINISSREYDAQRALVALAIETVLFNIGKPAHDEVIGRLVKDHRCHFPDCYEHPEYLKKILQDIYGNRAVIIIELIRKQLEGFEMQKGIDTFIARISA